jgi:D-alanyl-D-alanine carboxypeptidase/D-alanyl-D-alanine-endopeptidase (penicillin-binding protein 4)
VVSPITSLWADEGRERAGFEARSSDPALAAAQFFASALRRQGVRVAGQPTAAVAAPSAEIVATADSAPLAQIVARTLELSDNEAAEVLAHHVALADGLPPTFEGAAKAVRSHLADLGVSLAGAVIRDGSGLSRADRLSQDTLLQVLRVATERPELQAVVTGLPVAGFSGSLAYRFHTTPWVALGEVRAKTGTLTGVSGLAGFVTTRDGVLLAFVAVADRIARPDTLDARAALDRIGGALASCLCAESG